MHYPRSRVRARRLDWIVRHLDRFLFGALLVVVAIWVIDLIAGATMTGRVKTFDEQIVWALRSAADPRVPIGPRWLGTFFRDITALGGPGVLGIVISIVIAFLILSRQHRAAALVAATTLGGLLLAMALKDFFGRSRPPILDIYRESTASFPSGHSMMSAVVYLTLGSMLTRLVAERRLKLYFLGVACALAFLVGLSRIYLAAHYPSDVLAGWATGFAWALACWLVERRLQRAGAVEGAGLNVDSGGIEIPLEDGRPLEVGERSERG